MYFFELSRSARPLSIDGVGSKQESKAMMILTLLDHSVAGYYLEYRFNLRDDASV